MVEENIRLQYPNFCIAPIVGTFATIDTSNSSTYLRVKNSSGDTTLSYTFNPNITQDTDIDYIDYIGPRDLAAFQDGMVFITMESNIASEECTIKKWDFNLSNARLDLDYEIVKSTSGSEVIQCSNMAVARYYTNLSSTTVTGTSFIEIDNTDKLEVGTTLYLGPSTNTSYLNNYEEVLVTSISGNTVFISLDDGVPPLSYFNVTDPVTYLGDFYLFNEVGYGNDTTKGAMYTIDNFSGALKAYHNSAVYKDLAATNYGLPYSNTVAILKYTELLYIDVDNYAVIRSNRVNTVTNTYTDMDDIVEVFALAFTTESVYRLQEEKIVRSGFGDYAKISWTTYNYHRDSVFRFTDTLSLLTESLAFLSNQSSVTLVAYVRDQYGMALSGKTVHFDKESSDVGTWSDPNKEALTDINGKCTIQYTSAWYDSRDPIDVNGTILFTAYTDGSNILTGSIYVRSFMEVHIWPKLANNTTVTQIDNLFYSENNIEQVKNLESELGAVSLKDVVSYYGMSLLSDLVSVFKLTQKELVTGGVELLHIIDCDDDISIFQNYVSRHLPSGSNKDDVEIAQFRFILDMRPKPESEKNNVNTDIWVKLSPYGFDLNKDTVVFKVREISYAGDTGFIDYHNTSNLVITEFDAGGGLIGLELMYAPTNYFHNDAIVYVYLEVYDNASPSNRIEYDYYFFIIPDYIAPYIINESPARDEEQVLIYQNISFDVLDTEVGIDITTLDLYINNRIKTFSYVEILNGYTVTYTNTAGFFYDQVIEVSVRVEDSSTQENVLYDMWSFTCEESLAPEIDKDSFDPSTCVRGAGTRTTTEIFRVYDTGDGVDPNSVQLMVNGNMKDISLLPIIRRTY